MHETEVRHIGLNKYHILRSKDPKVLRQKAQALLARWEEMWKRRQEAAAKRQAREFQARSKEEKLFVADMKTEQAEKEIAQLESILSQGISSTSAVFWSVVGDRLA